MIGGITMSLQYAGSDTLMISEETPPGSVPLVRPEAIINVAELSYLIWDVANIDEQAAFLKDFGMKVNEKSHNSLFMRGYGKSPYIYYGRKAKKSAFKGIGLTAKSRSDLELLSHRTNTKIEAIQRPGGGEKIELTDPNGNLVEVVFGIESLQPLNTRREILPANTPSNRTRINQGQRTQMMPSPILRLGHCVLGANNFEATVRWYMHHFGLLATDALCIENGSPAIAFLRLNLGEDYADHHTIVIGKGGGEGYLHSAYEVVDIDAVAQGQQYQKMKKHKHVWGLGRHILGSQLFDYWHDPSGFEFEHYADGDVYTESRETEYHPLDSGNVYAWGDDLPNSFFALSLKQVLSIMKGLIKGDITIPWIKQAKKAMSRPPRPWL